MKYLRCCQKMFTGEYADVNLVKYLKPAA